MLASSSSRYCQDWRSPGQKWIRTALGWRPERGAVKNGYQIDVAPPEEGGAETTDPSNAGDDLKTLLQYRCAIVGTVATSKERHQYYTTLGEAIEMMNFDCALYDEKCYYYICKVLLHAYDKLFVVPICSPQVMTIKLTFAASNIALSSKDPAKIVTVSAVVDKGLNVLEKIVNGQSIERSLYQEKYRSLQKWKDDLSSLLECSNDHFSVLEDDCTRCIVSYLSHPRDILNLGLANKKLHSITEESWVWSCLAQRLFHSANSEPINTKEQFKCEYMKTDITLEEPPHNDAVRFCGCGKVFWKEYDHRCDSFHPNIKCKTLLPRTFLEVFRI